MFIRIDVEELLMQKIFRVFDYATCRAKDLIVTDTNYNKWNLGMGRIQYKTGLLGTVLDNNE